MQKYLTIIFFLLTVNFYAFSQIGGRAKIDSLKKILPSLRDSARVDCLNTLGFEYSNPYWNESHYVQTDTALLYTIQAQKEAQVLHYIRGIAASSQNLGMVEEQRGNYFKSERHTRLAIRLLEKTNMQTEFYRALVNLGWCAFNQGRYNEALDIYEKSLPYYRAIKDTTHIAMIYRMTGNAYANLGNTIKAFEYFQINSQIKKKADDIYGILNTPSFIGDLYMAAGDTAKALLYCREGADVAQVRNKISDYFARMSSIYKLRHQYDSAMYCYQQNLHFAHLTTTDSFLNKRTFVFNEQSMAEFYLMLKNYEQALTHCWKPLQVFAKGGDVRQLMSIFVFIAKAYSGKNDNEKALYYTKQLLSYAEKSRALPRMRDGYQLLWKIYDKQHQIMHAYKYHLKYTTLNDLIEGNNYKAKIAAWDALTKMTADEANYKEKIKLTEERNNTRIKLINKEKQTQLYLFYSVIIIGLLITIFFVRNTRLRKRKEQLQQLIIEANAQLEQKQKEQRLAELEREKNELKMQALRSQMNPHFIFNCLNSINSYIVRNDSDVASSYLTKFARLIRMVLQNSGRSFITLKDELQCLRLYMDLEALRFEQPFRYQIIFDDKINPEQIKIPPMLMQPFIENAIWHGLHPKKNGVGKICINMRLENNMLHCCISDNGIGQKQSIIQPIQSLKEKKSMGIKLTANRLELIHETKGTDMCIEIRDLCENDGKSTGTSVSLKIPVELIETD